MKHDQYIELLHLSFYHELGDEEQVVLNEHLASCAECRAEAVDFGKLESVLAKAPRFEVNDVLLDEARRDLRVALRLERTRHSSLSEWLEKLDVFSSPGLRLAFGGVAALVLGVAIGYLVFMPSDEGSARGMMPGLRQASIQQSQTRVSNFRIIQQTAETSEVEVSFDMVTPVRMKGNSNDNAMQRVMAQALMSDQNPGARLLTVSALANQVESTKTPDKEIKSALIQAMKADENVGVRREALKAVQRFQTDREIKDALLFVLKNESNPSMRIDVINFLEKPMLGSKNIDQDVLNGLKQSMQSDNNNYIRIRAKNIYEEANQQ
ncbi:MAG: HEAT repeat domain-containing protein [Ignavibacteriales bacterium]|nr:HEAT repeat domain-containing protein [Ignavibacteriales bacterium]